jgi:hypothetical protein
MFCCFFTCVSLKVKQGYECFVKFSMESCDHIICDHNNLTANILLLLDGLKVSHFLGAHGIFQNSLVSGKNPIELLVNWLAGLGILFSPNHSDR